MSILTEKGLAAIICVWESGMPSLPECIFEPNDVEDALTSGYLVNKGHSIYLSQTGKELIAKLINHKNEKPTLQLLEGGV